MVDKAKQRAEARARRHFRVRKKVYGTPERPRLNVFRSDKHIYAQVIDDTVGHTLAAASTVDSELVDQVKGKTKTEQAKLVGALVAQRAQEKVSRRSYSTGAATSIMAVYRLWPMQRARQAWSSKAVSAARRGYPWIADTVVGEKHGTT